MNIRLENSIVVIDEAHNLEDTCRESGSIEIRLAKLEGIAFKLSKSSDALQ